MPSKRDEDILATAKERFERCNSFYSRGRAKAKDDMRFAAASPDDPWQWHEVTRKERELQRRPCLTINKMPQHIWQVTNDSRQNRPSIRFRPADDRADVEVAEILMGVVRYIEANSDADTAYDTGSEHQVTCGEGFIRVLAEYAAPDSFEQEIRIRRVKNPFRIYLDPDIQCPAGSDAKFGFIEERLSEKEFKAQYPDAAPIDWDFQSDALWYDAGEKSVLVCEYFEIEETSAELYLWANGETSYKGDGLPRGVMAGEKPLKKRQSKRCQVIWRKLSGVEILEEKPFPGYLIPIARVVGNEWEIDGEIVTSGIVRNSKDSQRMYNVAQSAIVERVLQAPKTPWLAPIEALEGFEKVWQTANDAKHTFLPWNHLDAQGNSIPAPSRVSPTTVEPGLASVAAGANEDMKAETGQYDASLGRQSNETSGRAILARQREGDTATYHYSDNLAKAVRHVGRIILGMYPVIYDTRRVTQILGEDGKASAVTIDPDQPEPLTKVHNDNTGAIERSFNPKIGRYDVYASSGPSFNTKRVEAVTAMSEMTQANPQLWSIIGDQLVQNMDWPGADDIAKRLKVTLIPEVRKMLEEEDAPTPIPPQVQMAMQQMQQQMQMMQQALQEAQKIIEGKQIEAETKLHSDQLKQQAMDRQLQLDQERLEIDRFRAETDRLRIQIEADTRKDIASIGALTDLELAQQNPSPALQEELAEFPGE